MIFGILKDLFKSIEVLCRSVTILVGFERGLIVHLGGIRKKYLIRCHISRPKMMLVQFHEKWFSV